MTGIAAKCKRPPILLLSLIEGRVLWFGHNRELLQVGLGQIFGQALVQIDFCPNWSFGLAQVGIGQMKDTTHESVSTTHRAV